MRVILLSLAFAHALGAADLPRVEFPDVTLYDPQGTPSQVSQFRGAVVVLNFWATWCGPCRMELPELQKLYNQMGSKGLMVCAVNVDGDRRLAPKFFERNRLSLPLYFIDPATERALGIGTIPFTVVLDKEGRAVRAYPGFSLEGMRDMRQLIEQLLVEKRGQGGK